LRSRAPFSSRRAAPSRTGETHLRARELLTHELGIIVVIAPTAFTILTGSSNQFITLGTSSVPIAAYRITLNAPSSAGAKVTLVSVQAGIG
jgi:hypothetical protein